MKNEEIEKVIPPVWPKGKFLSKKNRRTRFKNKIKKMSGINEELLGGCDATRESK